MSNHVVSNPLDVLNYPYGESCGLNVNFDPQLNPNIEAMQRMGAAPMGGVPMHGLDSPTMTDNDTDDNIERY